MQLEELRADIIDLKEMYREQVDLLVNRVKISPIIPPVPMIEKTQPIKQALGRGSNMIDLFFFKWYSLVRVLTCLLLRRYRRWPLPAPFDDVRILDLFTRVSIPVQLIMYHLFFLFFFFFGGVERTVWGTRLLLLSDFFFFLYEDDFCTKKSELSFFSRS